MVVDDWAPQRDFRVVAFSSLDDLRIAKVQYEYIANGYVHHRSMTFLIVAILSSDRILRSQAPSELLSNGREAGNENRRGAMVG